MAEDGFIISNLIAMRRAIDRHNQRCPLPGKALLLNPIDFELMGIDMVWGWRIEADESVPVKRARIDCVGSAERIEEELETHTASDRP